MKFDPGKRGDTGTVRTLMSLTGALFELLKTEAFESITIQGICSASLIPRSTFYNYFSDKYDLLDYFLHALFAAALPDSSRQGVYDAMQARLCGAFDCIDARRAEVDELLRKNGEGGYFFRSLRLRFLSETEELFTSPGAELTAYFFACTLWSLTELKLFRAPALSAGEACAFLRAAINRGGLGI